MMRDVPSTVASLFAARARVVGDAPALVDDRVRWTYRELADRVAGSPGACARAASAWAIASRSSSREPRRVPRGVPGGGALGAIVACQNWRLAAPELAHCLELVEPALSSCRRGTRRGSRGRPRAAAIVLRRRRTRRRSRRGRRRRRGRADVDPEDALLDPVHERHHRAAQGRGDQPPRRDRAQPGGARRVRRRAGRRVRRVVAALSHGRGRVLARRADVGRQGDRRRRLRRARGSRDIVATRAARLAAADARAWSAASPTELERARRRGRAASSCAA